MRAEQCAITPMFSQCNGVSSPCYCYKCRLLSILGEWLLKSLPARNICFQLPWDKWALSSCLNWWGAFYCLVYILVGLKWLTKQGTSFGMRISEGLLCPSCPQCLKRLSLNLPWHSSPLRHLWPAVGVWEVLFYT